MKEEKKKTCFIEKFIQLIQSITIDEFNQW